MSFEPFRTSLDRNVPLLVVVGEGTLKEKVAPLLDGPPCKNSAQFGKNWQSYASFSDLEQLWTSLSEPTPGAETAIAWPILAESSWIFAWRSTTSRRSSMQKFSSIRHKMAKLLQF